MRMLETFVLSTGKESKTDCTMVTRMLVVIPQAVHVLVPALAIADTTGKRAESALCLAFDFTHVTLCDALIVTSSLAGRALASQQGLYLLEVFRWGKVTAAVSHVIFEAIGLLVALIAIWLWATEGLR